MSEEFVPDQVGDFLCGGDAVVMLSILFFLNCYYFWLLVAVMDCISLHL